MQGKCPNPDCRKIVNRVLINVVDGTVPFAGGYRCVTYNCPYCSTVLGVQMDPVAIMSDTVSQIRKGR